MSGWTVLNNTFVSVENGVLINGGRDHVITGNHFENVSGAPIYLVDECPTGKIMDSALLRAYGEVRKAAQDWPAWNKYNLSEYANLSGKYTGMRFFRLRLVNAADMYARSVSSVGLHRRRLALRGQHVLRNIRPVLHGPWQTAAVHEHVLGLCPQHGEMLSQRGWFGSCCVHVCLQTRLGYR